MGHLNINSLRNKFEALQFIINRNLDIILPSETKLDDSFPSAKFMLKNFGIPYRLDRNSNGGGLLLYVCEDLKNFGIPHRLDRNSNGGGLLLYVCEDIPSKFLKVKSDCNIESICVEVNLRKRNWFINGSYNPNKSFLSNHLESVNRIIDELNKLYQKFLFFGDFNASVSEKCLEKFCNLKGLTSLIKKPTCFKNPDKTTCINLILTNQSNCFQHSKVFETGYSDFFLLTVTEFKMSFQKLQPKIINYRDYKNFDNEKFRSDICKMNLNTTDLEGFMKTVFHIFNKHAPIKRIYIRANEAPFMTKYLHKAIVKRSKLRNKFLKSRDLSNTKRIYFNNFDIRKVTDNRRFCKTVVPLFSNKFSKSEKINLTEWNNTISHDNELCRVFNNFFSKTVDELKIPNISNYKLDNTNDPLKEALRYFENHPSITNIKSKSFDANFTF